MTQESDDFSIEEQEQKDGFFAKQSSSEYSRLLEKLKHDSRRSRLIVLRNMGRHQRLAYGEKYGCRWQLAEKQKRG